jgi:hypothetical protein
MPNSKRLLLASIHDIGPRLGSEVDLLADRLVRAPGYSLLCYACEPLYIEHHAA